VGSRRKTNEGKRKKLIEGLLNVKRNRTEWKETEGTRPQLQEEEKISTEFVPCRYLRIRGKGRENGVTRHRREEIW